MAYPTPASSIPQTPSEIEEIEMENQRSARATSNGASCSSTAADPNSNIPLFDVFINHRGEVKKNFASHLYRALLSRGLTPFLDQHDLQEGLPFPSQLEAVISKASVHVAIFSSKYAESRWCLDEFVFMRKSGAPIISVFYHVNPADLRWTAQNKTGVYATSLHKLELKKTLDSRTQQEKLRYDPATIEKWRDALSSVADIHGFDLNGKFNGDEVHMIDKIVERVGKLIRKPGLYVAKHPTGLSDKVTDFEATVFKQKHAGQIQVAGIVGLGGMGKTTLALELFNRMSSEHNTSYFLADVREKAYKSSLHSVQRELLRGLTQGLPERELDINNTYEGIGKFEKHLKSHHVLLILDDIDHEDQLEALLSFRNVLRPDSFILITSRYKDVLKRSGVEHFYQLRGLSKEHSQQLFCSYSFCQTYPFHGFEDLVDRFLEVCDGLPLALKVLGAHLFTKSESYWEAQLYELKVHSKVSTDIKNRLKISYEALSEEEQKIFLDIASFFIGEKKSSAIAVWDASGWNGLLGLINLEGKCLVEVDDKNVIHMHDQLRDLGRHIAEEETPRRLWRPTGNIDNWLHKQSYVLTEPRGIMMLPQGDSIERSKWNYDASSCYQWWSQQLLGNFLMEPRNIFRYSNLQLVETEGRLLDRILRLRSPNLIWLSWRHCPYTSLPSWITIKKLRVLKVEGRVLKTLWKSKSQAPLLLHELEIINATCLSSIPKSIGQMKHLERIVIHSSFLTILPEEFGHLNSLTDLVLDAGSLKSLPDSLGKLTNLHRMELYGCGRLERLRDSFGSLTNLHSLDLSYCKILERLPDSFGSLSNLHSLNMRYCRRLERLPDSFGSLSNLHSLDLLRCSKLERLPDSFGSLSNLHSLDLLFCSKLERLPDSFGSLTNLHSLHLRCCSELERLPDSFGSLTNLHSMDLSWFNNLERLPDSFGSLTNLHSLNLRCCSKLERLPDSFGSLTNLQSLDLGSCGKLERLPDSFGSLTALKYFDVSWSANLRISSETFGNMRTLEHIDLSGCGKVEVWPWQLAHQRSLKTLKLTGTNFEEMPSAIELPRDLEVVCIGNPLLERVMPSSLGDLLNLKELHLEYRGDLKCLSASVERSSELSSLKVAGCPIIHTSEVLFDEVVYPNLTELMLEECINLVEVGTLPKALTSVRLSSCYNVRNIEGLSGLAMFRRLDIKKCNELEELPSVKTMVSLQFLWVTDCVKLKSILDLRWLTELKSLVVHGCPQLGELEGVADCTSLEYFSVKGCPKLRLDERAAERLRQKCTWHFHLEEPNGS